MTFPHRSAVYAALLAGIGCMAVSAQAEQLEPVLMAQDLVGTVQVQRSGRSKFEPVEAGKAYPYGSHFRSEAESGVTLALSGRSSVRVLAMSDVAFAESRVGKTTKTVQVMEGEVEATLGKTFHEDGNVLNIEAGLAIIQATGTRYRVASRHEEDLRIVIVRVIEGVVRVIGETFEITDLEEEEWVSLLGPRDASFLRLKNMQGTYQVTMKDEDHSDRLIDTTKGTVLKIWQRVEPESGDRIVTSVLNDPDGEMINTTTVVFPAGEFANYLAGIRDEGDTWDGFGEGLEGEPTLGRNNPVMPPDAYMDELVNREIEDENPGAGRRRPTPRPPRRPTPTPVGNL